MAPTTAQGRAVILPADESGVYVTYSSLVTSAATAPATARQRRLQFQRCQKKSPAEAVRDAVVGMPDTAETRQYVSQVARVVVQNWQATDSPATGGWLVDTDTPTIYGYATESPAIWTNTITAGTAGMVYTLDNGGTAASFVITGTGSVWHEASPVEDAVDPLLNHHKKVARSYHKDKQFADAHPAEIIALGLLRKMISHDDFRKYLKHGFVAVQGASGLTYQVRRNETIVVWDRGERIATLCVHLALDGKSVPPTDHVVGKMLIVECCEADIWKRSNITWVTQKRSRRSLELVGQAA